ncbi:MAG TPA: NUDIX hydrolase [Frankiaceae bacterium]|nr:NUDIX hydrolase [Frankiaceae bacterium]
MTAGPHRYTVTDSDVVYRGKVVDVRRDVVAMPGGGTSQRDVVVHPGAVGVVALDDTGRVMLLRQYRHPVGAALWELPAGILDVPDEPASRAAARELAEEVGLTARRWDLLVDVYTSPGMTDEAIRVYLARDLVAVPDDERHVGVDEEADLELAWVGLDDAVTRVLAGGIGNAMAVIGLLAAAAARDRGFAPLRPVASPWPARPHHGG